MRNSALTVLAVCVILLFTAAATLGQTAEGDESARPSGSLALTASAAYPGLGQLLNGSETKAAVIGAAEAFLLARLVLEDRWTRNSYRNYAETGTAAWYNEYAEHYDRRQALIWWVAVVAIYGLIDAYVDAHLVDFDDPLPGYLDAVSIAPGPSGDELRLALSIRF